jgi:probable F420-dependent oxidoreductase
MVMDIGRIGIWSAALRRFDLGAVVEAAAELDELGFSALWFPGGERDGFAERMTRLLQATRRAVIAPGIVSIWTHPSAAIAAEHQQFKSLAPERWLLGLGVSHGHAVARVGLTYDKPIQKLRAYLDELDAASPPVPKDERIVAALGPVALKLAGERSLGTHPYFVPVEHTRVARQTLGPGKLIATEQMVLLETDPTTAREKARQHMAMYLAAPNYANNLLRLGYPQSEIDNGGSDRLVDDIVAWGTPEKVLQRVREHHAAGADHVCIQVLTADRGTLALSEWRQLSAVMKG